MEASVPIPEVETDAEGRGIGTSAISESEERDEALSKRECDGAYSHHCQPTCPEVIGAERSVIHQFLPLEAKFILRKVEMEDRSCLQ